jgi:AraC-like DNA-binding protein
VSLSSVEKALPLVEGLQRGFAGGLVQVLAAQQQHGIARLHSHDLQGNGMVVAEATSFAIHSVVLRQPCESISLGFWLYGTADVHSASQGKSTTSGPGLLYCLLPGQSLELFTRSPSCQWVHITIESHRLDTGGQDLGDLTVRAKGLCDRLKPEAPFLTGILQRFLRSSGDEGQPGQQAQRQALEQVVVTHVAAALHRPKPAKAGNQQPTDPLVRSRQAEHVRQALNHLEQHYASPLNLQTISSACGVSPRTLQAAFLQDVGYSPMQALQTIRLTKLHQNLHAGISVAQSCEAVGLRMSGRLAGLYQARFGELPRETLMRARSNQD